MSQENELYADLIKVCEDEIRAGLAHRAAKRLARVNAKRVGRMYRLPLANLCRRTGLVALGLRLLTPVIRPNRRTLEEPARAIELAEYAVLLQRFGATKEALGILSTLKPNEAPEASLFKAYCYFNLWEYENAIPSLNEYLAGEISPYARLVGQVNLAAAYLETMRLQEAEELLEKNIAIAKSGKFARLEGNCLEMLAKTQINARKYSQADASLKRASEVFSTSQTHDQLFVRGSLAALEAFKTSSAEPLRAFRKEALERNEYESVRETDLQILEIEYNEQEFNHLYFGTPFRAFRSRIESILGRKPLRPNYTYGAENVSFFDVASGFVDLAPTDIRGGLLHQTLEILLRDFYRPLATATLFAELHQGDYFDIYSSPHRVEQILHRLRVWLAETKAPVELRCNKGKHSIHINGPYAFRVYLRQQPIDSHAILLAQLEAKFVDRTSGFTAIEARQELKLSASSFRRFISWTTSENLIERFGASTNTRYYFAQKSEKSAS